MKPTFVTCAPRQKKKKIEILMQKILSKIYINKFSNLYIWMQLHIEGKERE